MRISSLAVAIICLATINDTNAGYDKPRSFILSTQQHKHPLWGVVSYGGGEDALSSSTADEQEEKNAGNNDKVNKKINNTSSSQILNSVSAGGGSPVDTVMATTSAFVGVSKSTVHKSTTTTIQRPLGTTETASTKGTSSPLTVATNEQKNAEEAVDEKAVTFDSKGNHRRPLKILFLSSDTGGGHRASAEALANQFQRLFPGTTYDLLDIWTDVDSSWPYYTIKDTYKSFSATPWKWRALYHISNNAIYSKFADLHSYYMNEDLIREKMESYNPDVVVSVHPTMNYVPLFSIRKVSEKLKRDIPFFTVVTDFGSGHCTWFNKDVDKMYLASDPIKLIAQRRGDVPDEKIVMSGLPIRYDFAAQADALDDRTTKEGKAHQLKIREQLNINTKKKMILVMGGGEGVGSLSDIVNELYAKLRTQGVDATICVVCGRNEKLFSELQTRSWDSVVSKSLQSYESLKSRFYTKVLSLHAHRSRRIQLALDKAAAKSAKGKDVALPLGNVDVVPLGFVRNMAEYMVAADVLVTKAGPGTIAEAAAVGLPIMVTSHLPGQEAGNVDIVLNGGFGDFCEDPETIGLEVACWLQDSQLLDVMSKKAMKVGHPHAAEEIAQDIGQTTLQWMKRNELRQK